MRQHPTSQTARAGLGRFLARSTGRTAVPELRTALAAAALTTVVLTGTAQAQAPAPVPVNTPYFFQCKGAQPAAKVQTGIGSWSTARPSASYTTGAGCGFAETLLTTTSGPSPQYDLIFEGTHTGPVHTITLELHELLLSHVDANAFGGEAVVLGLEVDGVAVNDMDAAHVVPLTPSASGASNSMKVSFTNLKVTDADEHTYRVSVMKDSTAAAWVWGASEIASGVEFNPARALGHRIRAS